MEVWKARLAKINPKQLNPYRSDWNRSWIDWKCTGLGSPRESWPHGIPREPDASSQHQHPNTGALKLLLAEGLLQTDNRKVSYSLPLLGPPSLGSYIYYSNY